MANNSGFSLGYVEFKVVMGYFIKYFWKIVERRIQNLSE